MAAPARRSPHDAPAPAPEEAAPRAVPSDPVAAVEALFRAAPDRPALGAALVDRTRALLGFRQAFLFTGRPGALRVTAVSSLAAVDRTQPLVRALEAAAGRFAAVGAGPVALDASADPRLSGHPFAFGLALPLADRAGAVFGLLLAARETPWRAEDAAVAARLAGTFAHAWCAFGRPGRRPGRRLATVAAVAGLLAAAAALALPVPLSTLAPAEIVARDAFVVAAPLDGVVADLPHAPGTRVEAGATVLTLVATRLRAELDLAERARAVAAAKLEKSRRGALSTPDAAREAAVLEAELALADAERDAARERLDRATVAAPRAGVLVYPSRADLLGKPVATGERILEIADPERVEARLDLGLGDQIAVAPGARVRVFLDGAPLDPIEARIERVGYQAVPGPDQRLVFRLAARLDAAARPRLGARGTARIEGETVPLAVHLFRRPLASLRQTWGF